MDTVNEKEDLHPIGSYVISWFSPDEGSTELPVKRETLYIIKGHEKGSMFPNGPVRWIETLRAVALIKHSCSVFDKEKLPPLKYINDDEHWEFLQRLDKV